MIRLVRTICINCQTGLEHKRGHIDGIARPNIRAVMAEQSSSASPLWTMRRLREKRKSNDQDSGQQREALHAGRLARRWRGLNCEKKKGDANVAPETCDCAD